MKSKSIVHCAVYVGLLLLALQAGTAAQSGAESARPNILILYADDWRHDTLGVAGHPVVQTPNLDQLAAEGIRFVNSYVTTSICGVSRASLYTGQWMSRHGNRGFNMWETPWEETYLALLRKSGYYLGHVGKWHNGAFPQDKFDFGRAYHGKHWYRLNRSDEHETHITQRNENDAMEFLRQRPKDQPFYLTVAFFTPHAEDGHPLQYLPQPESLSLYEGVEIPRAPSATRQAWERLPDFFDSENEGRNRWRWRFDTPEKYQSMMKNYFRLITEIDATSGRILAELEAQGVLDNTLVIFTTDNGYYHAEHGLADKWYPHEESIRVPLIIKDPRMHDSRSNTTEEAMALNVDLASTILAAAGLEPSPGMQGRDLSPLYLAENKPEWREEFFYEHPTLRDADFIPASEALVRSDWKYFYWPEHDVEQLFHLSTDPYELKDLAADPYYHGKLAQLRAHFTALKSAASAQPEPAGERAIKPESLQAYLDRMQWFAEAQYGMFIHFGLYSMLGGIWDGEDVPGYAEWIQGQANIDREVYAAQARQFNPTAFNSEQIVQNAKAAGMTYLVVTAKHHEGFCLWDSAYTEFDVASTPFKGRDILQELQQACAKYGIRFGIYYSIIDWHHPSQVRPSELGEKGWPGKTRIVGDRKQAYVDYQRNQVLELVAKYDPAILWFDGDWADWWTMEDGIDLYHAIRRANPDVIVNDRVAKRGKFELDYATQEQRHFDQAFGRYWEGCYTLNKSWGYKQNDDNWKSPAVIYEKLKDINEKGGALLLNVGPDGNGVVQDEAWQILRETAKLVEANPIRKQIPDISVVPGIQSAAPTDDHTNIDGI